MKKKLLGSSFYINIANFESFLSVKKLSANLFFLKSVKPFFILQFFICYKDCNLKIDNMAIVRTFLYCPYLILILQLKFFCNKKPKIVLILCSEIHNNFKIYVYFVIIAVISVNKILIKSTLFLNYNFYKNSVSLVLSSSGRQSLISFPSPSFSIID